jgi:hypothetical protein
MESVVKALFSIKSVVVLLRYYMCKCLGDKIVMTSWKIIRMVIYWRVCKNGEKSYLNNASSIVGRVALLEVMGSVKKVVRWWKKLDIMFHTSACQCHNLALRVWRGIKVEKYFNEME